jgi:NADPH-dependent curcumin reductase CurA
VTEHRYWRLDRHPCGRDFASAFSLQRETVPKPADGEVLIRADWLSMDAGTRMWVTPRTDGYQPPLPLGSKMVGLVLGRVVRSRAKGIREGDLVRAFGQWGELSLVRPELSDLRRMDETVGDAREHFGVLGMNGWTAYAGIVDIGQAKAGETVLVSAAAGATGLLAAQVARNLGCHVIGLAGSDAKCRFLVDQLQVDRAINYRNVDVAAELAKIDGGIDVYFDNVGGPLLDAVLPNMALHGRVAVCGLVATYDAPELPPGPRHFDQILMKRLTVRGFFSPDFAARGDEINRVMRAWMDEGRMLMRFDETRGIENVLIAYDRMFSGANLGKVIVDLRD